MSLSHSSSKPARCLERRDQQLTAATEARIQAGITAVEEKLDRVFTQAEQTILLAHAQRRAWLSPYERLRTSSTEGGSEQRQRTVEEIERLNDFFLPLVKLSPTISSLMVASADGVEYMLFDDPDAGNLEPPYRFVNRVVHEAHFGDAILQAFWRSAADARPRVRWLSPGMRDSRGRIFQGYQPTRRPWFQAALRRGREGVAWTEPYVFFVTRDAGITGSIAWQQQGQMRVLGVDFMLTDLPRITTELESGVDVLTAAVRSPGAQHDGLFPFEYRGQHLWAGRARVGRPGQGLTLYVVQVGGEA